MHTNELRAEYDRLRVALEQIEDRATHGYQDLNSGGVLASIRLLAREALQ